MVGSLGSYGGYPPRNMNTNAASRASGASEASGMSGAGGVSGASEASGMSGAGGVSGASGSLGASGISANVSGYSKSYYDNNGNEYHYNGYENTYPYGTMTSESYQDKNGNEYEYTSYTDNTYGSYWTSEHANGVIIERFYDSYGYEVSRDFYFAFLYGGPQVYNY